MQRAGDRGNVRIMPGLGLIGGEVCVAIGIEQAQSREVALGTELLGRGSEQQQPLGLLTDSLDELIFVAGLGLAPFEMMCFIDDQHIPARFLSLLGALGIGGKKIDAAQNDLIIVKRIFLRQPLLDGRAAFLVEDVCP